MSHLSCRMGMGGIRELLNGKIWEWDLSFRWEWEWDGNGNEVIEMGGNWYEKSVPAHLYFPVLLGLCAVHRAALSSAARPSVCRPINVLNVQTITINVNKRVYYEENDKRLQKLTINVDIFQTVFKLCIEYCCSSCKFEIPVRSCSASDSFSRFLALY